jgi:Cu-processing system permease protein
MFARIYVIAQTTLKEIIRSKILYSIFLFIVLILGLSTFYGKASIGDEIKVIKDFGLMGISLFTTAFCVISGASLLAKELAKKTVYNILGKYVYRSEFLIGKFFGMYFAAIVMVVIMSSALSLYIGLLDQKFDPLMLEAYYFICLEVMIICATTLFFSSVVVTPALSGLFTFALFIVGRSAEQILKFAQMSKSSLPTLIYNVIPHLTDLTVANEVVYGESRSIEAITYATLYAVSYSGVLLLLSVLVFRKRQFN